MRGTADERDAAREELGRAGHPHHAVVGTGPPDIRSHATTALSYGAEHQNAKLARVAKANAPLFPAYLLKKQLERGPWRRRESIARALVDRWPMLTAAS